MCRPGRRLSLPSLVHAELAATGPVTAPMPLWQELIMRMLMHVHLPHEPFNTFVRDGTAGNKLQAILGEQKPEAVYFSEQHGTRSIMLVVDLESSSQIPFFGEPWFLTFEADCEFRVAMTPEDLGAAGLDGLGAKWG